MSLFSVKPYAKVHWTLNGFRSTWTQSAVHGEMYLFNPLRSAFQGKYPPKKKSFNESKMHVWRLVDDQFKTKQKFKHVNTRWITEDPEDPEDVSRWTASLTTSSKPQTQAEPWRSWWALASRLPGRRIRPAACFLQTRRGCRWRRWTTCDPCRPTRCLRGHKWDRFDVNEWFIIQNTHFATSFCLILTLFCFHITLRWHDRLLLRTMEVMLIPVSPKPVRNLSTANTT